jgi:hypothetical protein
MSTNKPDPVQHPTHYTQGKIEIIDYILDQKMGFCEGNVIKYTSRYRYKGKPLEDLKKARFYLDALIKLEEEKLTTFPAIELASSAKNT